MEKEFTNFLRNLDPPKTPMSALPTNVIAFLVWKDRNGRPKVHQDTCPMPRGSRLGCGCPKRLAFGTVDSLIGKFRSIFCNAGRGSEWHALLGVGNPASCHSVRKYLEDVREEQLKARVAIRQAEPILLADLEIICSFIHARLLNVDLLSPAQLFILARDQAVFKALFFAGDRAADLFQLKTVDVLCFPDNSGLLFNHCWSKTLREILICLHLRVVGSSRCCLAGVGLSDIMEHIGWKSNKTALHYIKLKQVMNPAGAASTLADLNPHTGQSYTDWNVLKGFVPYFIL